VPHLTPLILLVLFKFWQKCDRSWSKDKRKTKQLLQSSYEWLHIGPEIMLDNRLAQIVCLTWCTFQFSIALPFIVVLTTINLFCMYWVDKYLLLRFYRSPKNYDRRPINYVLHLLKFTFLMHFIFGILFISNSDILTNNHEFVKLFKQINGFLHDNMKISLTLNDRFDSKHVVFFFIANLSLILLIVFEEFFMHCLFSKLQRFKDLQKQFDEMDAVTDDYYDEMHLKYLLTEHVRTKVEKTKFKTLLSQSIKHIEDRKSIKNKNVVHIHL
jgi:hypothetical protein